MKKITQVTTAAILLSAIVSAGAFASDNKKSGEKSRPEISRTHQRNSSGSNQDGENTNRAPRQMKIDENTIIGQVKSVDAKNNKIKVADADGNITEYAVTGFTKITSMKTPAAKPDDAKPGESKSTEKKSDDAKTDGTKSDEAKSDEAKSDGRKPGANFGDRRGPSMNHGKPGFGPGQMMEELKLSDVKEGSWVMLSVLDGTTKTKQADKIFVKAAE